MANFIFIYLCVSNLTIVLNRSVYRIFLRATTSNLMLFEQRTMANQAVMADFFYHTGMKNQDFYVHLLIICG